MIPALKRIWILGDNFVAGSYQTCFKMSMYPFFMKSCYEVKPFCSSRFNDKNENLLSRLQITVANAVNVITPLPDYMVFVLDGDIIQYLNFRAMGVSVLLGTMLEWIFNQVHSLVLERKKLLPKFVKTENSPFIYWVELPKHMNFDAEENVTRGKFNLCMESIAKKFSTMRVVKLKEI